MTKELKVSLILASASPRRKELLAKAGYKFTVVPPTVDEGDFSGEDVRPAEYAKKLALAKAKDVACRYPSAIVIGADTVCDFDGRIVGKPADVKDAERITRMLFSRPHKVITAVAVVKMDEGVEFVEAESTTVYPRRLTEQQIAEHIRGNNWQGKAGAYGIQETGDEFVERIDGSLTNVMGFPMELVEKLLEQFAK